MRRVRWPASRSTSSSSAALVGAGASRWPAARGQAGTRATWPDRAAGRTRSQPHGAAGWEVAARRRPPDRHSTQRAAAQRARAVRMKPAPARRSAERFIPRPPAAMASDPGPSGALATLQLVFGSDLPPGLVQQVFDAEGNDVKLCTQVLWEVLPEVRCGHRSFALLLPGHLAAALPSPRPAPGHWQQSGQAIGAAAAGSTGCRRRQRHQTNCERCARCAAARRRMLQEGCAQRHAAAPEPRPCSPRPLPGDAHAAQQRL